MKVYASYRDGKHTELSTAIYQVARQVLDSGQSKQTAKWQVQAPSGRWNQYRCRVHGFHKGDVIVFTIKSETRYSCGYSFGFLVWTSWHDHPPNKLSLKNYTIDRAMLRQLVDDKKKLYRLFT